MRRLFLILCVLSTPACGLFQGSPVFTKPRKESVAGRYSVEKISLGVPGRREMKSLSLLLADSGIYEFRSRDAKVPSSPLLPAGEGVWELVPVRGMDLGSRETWGVRFSPARGSAKTAWLLDENPPHRILFADYSRRQQVGEVLVLKKDDTPSAVQAGAGR